MNSAHQDPRRVSTALALGACLLAIACADDPTRPPGAQPREYGVVLNSTGLSLTVFPVDAPDSSYTIPLGASGTPASLAVRGRIALVPLGLFPGVAVVDLQAAMVLRTIPLPANGGATGVAIANDSTGFVANPELSSVSPVRFVRGVALTPIDVGPYPQALAARGDRVFVLEANLANFQVQGVSSISVIDADALEVDAAFALSGRNAGDALISGDSVVYVLNRGDYGADNGSVSVIRLPLAAEADHHEGFGGGTGTLAEFGEESDLAVSSYLYGVALFDPESAAFVVAPEAGVTPTGAVNVLAVGSDSEGRLYVVGAGNCIAPGSVFRVTGSLTAPTGPIVPITVGACPVDIEFTTF